MFENLRRGRQERNFTTNVPKILGVKSSSEQILSENCRWVPLITGKVIDVSRTHIPLKALMIPLKRVKLRGV